MAGDDGDPRVKANDSRLIAIDGVSAAAIRDAARRLASSTRRRRGGVSSWGASGIFDELGVADADAGTPSMRTLLLLYAADLAFRLRWEIGPALEEGRLVIAAPYVATAVAVGRAAGLDAAWLADLFHFAPPAAEQHLIDSPSAGHSPDHEGFVELACLHAEKHQGGPTRLELMDRTRRHLSASVRRPAAG